MTSWIMKFWLENHDKSKCPDLDIRQPVDASHVTNAGMHPSKQNIESMCSEDFFDKHWYRRVDIRRKMFPKEVLAEDESPYSSPYSDLSVRSQACKENKTGSPDYTSKRKNEEHKNKANQMDCSKHNKPTTNISKGGTKNENYQQKAHKMSQDNCSIDEKATATFPQDAGEHTEHHKKTNQTDGKYFSKYDKPTTNIVKGAKKNENYQQRAHSMNQDPCTIDEEPIATLAQDKGGNEEYQDKTLNKQKKDCSMDNKSVACILEDSKKNEDLETLAPKLDQSVCPKYDKPAAYLPEGREENEECQNVVISGAEDQDQTRNVSCVRARREIKWQIRDTFAKAQPWRPSSFHEK